jgi:hypothetical protein
MSDSRAHDVVREHEAMVTDRALFDSLYIELEERFSYKGRHVNNKRTTQGEKSSQRIWDETCLLAADRFAAACEAMITPRTGKYQKLAPSDPDLADHKPSVDWCEEKTDLLFRARYSPQTNFASQMSENYWSIGVYGTGTLFVDDMVGRGLLYRAIHIAESYFAENQNGVVDKFHRSFEPTLRQIVQRFGQDALPAKLRGIYERSPETRVPLIHCVRPNQERVESRSDYRGMAFSSYYTLPDERVILEESGYRTMPYCVGRYSTSPRETYGRGPGMMALAAIKNLNEMVKTLIRSGQRAVDPVFLLTDDALLQPFDIRNGAMNFGGLDANGNPLIKPLMDGARVDIGFDFAEREARIINDAFLVSLFQILVDQPQMTATEAMLRAQEKGQLLAPTMGRLQSEQLHAITVRELDILAAAGLFEDAPDELIGQTPLVQFESPLNRLQKAEDGIGILRTFEQLAPLMQIDPSAVEIVDIEATARILAEVNGMPSRGLRDKKQMEAIREGRREQAEVQTMLQAAPVAASAAKDIAMAQQLARQAPGPLPGVGA